MLSIRLSKVGKKGRPSYRLVVAEKRSSRNGRAIEILGHFDPFQKEGLKINKERFDYWLKNGACQTAAVSSLIAGNYHFKPYKAAKRAS